MQREILNVPVKCTENVSVIDPENIPECYSDCSGPRIAVVGQLEFGVVMDACPIVPCTPVGNNARIDAQECRLAPINTPTPE